MIWTKYSGTLNARSYTLTCPYPFPLLPQTHAQPSANPLVERRAVRFRRSQSEVSNPAHHVLVQFPNSLIHGDGPGSGGQLSDATLEALDRLRSQPDGRFPIGKKAESKEPPLPRPIHRACQPPFRTFTVEMTPMPGVLRQRLRSRWERSLFCCGHGPYEGTIPAWCIFALYPDHFAGIR